MISQTKPLKTKSFLPFNFSVTNICVAIRLAYEGGTRMGGIYFQLSPSFNLLSKSNSENIQTSFITVLLISIDVKLLIPSDPPPVMIIVKTLMYCS